MEKTTRANVISDETRPHPNLNGTQRLVFFDNGYGASIIDSKPVGSILGGGYTDTEHPYEIAVKIGTPDCNKLCYGTHITDDVLGYQTAADVENVLRQISELPAVPA